MTDSPLAPEWLPYPEDANQLDEKMWPSDISRNSSGEVTISDIPVTEIVEEYQTPVYVISHAQFNKAAQTFKDAFTQAFKPLGVDVDIFYAGKAFLSVEIAKWVDQAGLHLDTCSSGELLVASKAAVPGSKLGLHGNNKSDQEIRQALEMNVSRIIVDSLEELERIDSLTAQYNAETQNHEAAPVKKAPVLIRLTPGVHAHTHDFIATAHEDQKFGLSINAPDPDNQEISPAEQAVILAEKLENINLLGLHCHIGSQIFEPTGFELAARRVIEFMGDVKKKYDLEFEELDLGGGYGIAYTSVDNPREPSEIAQALAQVLSEASAENDVTLPRLSIEPGRSIVGPAGITLYTVGTIKDVVVDTHPVGSVNSEKAESNTRKYIAVDGGMSDNPRPVLYDADYSAVLANRYSDNEPVISRVVGKHCESGDIVVRDAYLQEDIARDDILAVPGTGAYTWALSNNYNYLKRSPVIAVKNGNAELIIRGETDDDLLSRDVSA